MSWTIIVTDANALTRTIHDRMPVVLNKADIGPWLNRAAGTEVLRPAGEDRLLLALIGEVSLSHIERLGETFAEVCRYDRAGLHSDVQHYRPQRVARVTDRQRDVALTGEGDPP